MANKQKVFSGIQPTGALHIGNYLGAIKQWLELQKTHNCVFCIVDYHAITVPYEPKEMPDRIFETALDYFALGLDPKKSTIFIQSHVPEHTELAWLLNTITPISELEFMTHFKEKAGINRNKLKNTFRTKFVEKFYEKIVELDIKDGKLIQEASNDIKKYLNSKEFDAEINNLLLSFRGRANAALLDYPVLMASDILLYHANLVPVGEDQKQHVELTRTIARKFNNQFGETLTIPEVKLSTTKRIMSLADPTKKMSKSLGPKHYLALSDSPETIREKISKAVTGTGTEKELPDGTINLLGLLKEFGTESEFKKFEQAANNGSIKYSELKTTLAEAIIKKLKPFQKKRAELAKDPKKIWNTLEAGAKKARPLAQKTLTEAKQKMGLI